MPVLMPGVREERKAASSKLMKGWIKTGNPHPKIVCRYDPNCRTTRRLVAINHGDPSLRLMNVWLGKIMYAQTISSRSLTVPIRSP